MTERQHGIACFACVVLLIAAAAWTAADVLTRSDAYCSGGTVALLLFVLAWLTSLPTESEP